MGDCSPLRSVKRCFMMTVRPGHRAPAVGCEWARPVLKPPLASVPVAARYPWSLGSWLYSVTSSVTLICSVTRWPGCQERLPTRIPSPPGPSLLCVLSETQTYSAHAHTHTHTRTYTETQMPKSTHADTFTHVNTRTFMLTHATTQAHIHSNVHEHSDTHTHTNSEHGRLTAHMLAYIRSSPNLKLGLP